MPDESTLRPLSVWMREWDADGDVLPMGFVIAAEDLEARVRALEAVAEAAKTVANEVESIAGYDLDNIRPAVVALIRALDATKKGGVSVHFPDDRQIREWKDGLGRKEQAIREQERARIAAELEPLLDFVISDLSEYQDPMVGRFDGDIARLRDAKRALKEG